MPSGEAKLEELRDELALLSAQRVEWQGHLQEHQTSEIGRAFTTDERREFNRRRSEIEQRLALIERRGMVVRQEIDELQSELDRQQDEALARERAHIETREQLLAQRRRQVEEREELAQRDAELDREERRHWSRRFNTSLAIGNGAAFAAITSKVFDAAVTKPVVALAFPAVLFFALGVVAAGALPLAIAQGWKREERWLAPAAALFFVLGINAAIVGLWAKGFGPPIFQLWMQGK